MSQLPFLLPASKASQLQRNRLNAPSQWPLEQQDELRSKHTEGEMEAEHMSGDRSVRISNFSPQVGFGHFTEGAAGHFHWAHFWCFLNFFSHTGIFFFTILVS